MATLGAMAPGRFDWICRVTRLMWLSDRRSDTINDLTYLPPSVAGDDDEPGWPLIATDCH